MLENCSFYFKMYYSFKTHFPEHAYNEYGAHTTFSFREIVSLCL